MKIKAAREKAGLLQRRVAKALQAVEPKIGVPEYSKMEKGIVNPTPEQFRVLCTLFNVPPMALANRSDVDYGLFPIPGKAKRDKRLKTASIRFRVLPSRKAQIQTDLEACGYATFRVLAIGV